MKIYLIKLFLKIHFKKFVFLKKQKIFFSTFDKKNILKNKIFIETEVQKQKATMPNGHLVSVFNFEPK